MTVPIPSEMNVVSEAVTAEAKPAICPRGSIAAELKLPNRMP